MCSTEISAAPRVDTQHREIMRLRLATLRATPMVISTDDALLKGLYREKDRCSRVVLEFGHVDARIPGDDGKAEATIFVRLVPAPGGSLVYRGSESAPVPESEGLVSHVSVSVSAPKHVPTELELSRVSRPEHPQLGYAVTRGVDRRAVVRITVHWNLRFWMAPVQICFGFAPGASSRDVESSRRRRVVVQLPVDVAKPKRGASAGKPEAEEGGSPLRYGDECTPATSGWVTYMPGMINPGRAQGTVALARPQRSAAPPELANRWMERLAEETEEAVMEAAGLVRDVQMALVSGASNSVPLERLVDVTAAEKAARGEAQSQSLLLRSICEGSDPAVVCLYDSMMSMVQAKASKGAERGQEIADLLQERDRNATVETSFFQVRDRPRLPISVCHMLPADADHTRRCPVT